MALNLQTLLTSPTQEIDKFYFQKLSQEKPLDYNVDLSSQFDSVLQAEHVNQEVDFYSL